MKLLARVTLVAPLMLGAFAVDASAQPKPPIAGRMPGGPMQPAFTPVSQSFASVSVDNLRKTGDVATNGSLDGVPLLSGFRTRFMNGDHKLAHVGVLAASSTSAKVTFSDQNGDDPFRATRDVVGPQGRQCRPQASEGHRRRAVRAPLGGAPREPPRRAHGLRVPAVSTGGPGGPHGRCMD